VAATPMAKRKPSLLHGWGFAREVLRGEIRNQSERPISTMPWLKCESIAKKVLLALLDAW
jgi:hypothetical protein